MTWRALLLALSEQLSNISREDKTDEEFDKWLDSVAPVSFDFPLMGVNRNYQIYKVTPNGFILKNNDCVRPQGH